MDHMWTRVATHLIDRVSGPMKFRLVLQPLTASFFAIKSGLADAKAGRPPYFWSLCTDPANRAWLLKDGWKRISKVFIFAIVLDIVYQLIELHFVYIGEAIIVAFVLAIVPYVILRGPVERLARKKYLRDQNNRQTILDRSKSSG
jgi:predicted LPLAT superfamily acyltransferase